MKYSQPLTSLGFVPPRPQPLSRPLKNFSLALAARKNLLAVWTKEDYDAKCATSRIFGRQIVVVNAPDAIKYVMVTANENFERKSPQMRRALEGLLGDGLFISDGDTWRRRRPLVADIVHASRLPVFGLTMEACIAEWCEGWEQHSTDAHINLLSSMAELTAGIIARTVFGNRLGRTAARDVVDGFASFQARVDNFNLPYFLGLNDGLRQIATPKLSKAIQKVHKVIDQVIEEHLAGNGDAASMVEMLLRRQARIPEASLDVSALRNEAATIFMAGHETTATTLTWALYLVANAPHAEAAITAEIASVSEGRQPKISDVSRLEWCRAVIEETLRLYPPVPFLTRQAKHRENIAGIDIDPAALVIISPWLLHRSPQLWERPDDFYPERFLSASRPEKYTYLPFSAGPRVCAGQAFGLSEAILCLASLLQRFKILPVPDVKIDAVCRLSLRPENGIPVTIHKR